MTKSDECLVSCRVGEHQGQKCVLVSDGGPWDIGYPVWSRKDAMRLINDLYAAVRRAWPDEKDTTLYATGFMECAVQTRDKDFMPGMITDDADGMCRLYIDRDRKLPRADDAMDFANSMRSSEKFRMFSHGYAIVGTNINDGDDSGK